MSGLECVVVGHWGAYPGAGEACSCYLLRSGGTSVLLDCGSGALSVIQAFVGLHDLDAVILSHYHADHVADVGPLQYAAYIDTDLGRRKAPLPIYGPPDELKFPGLSYRTHTVGVRYGDGESIRVGPMSFRFALGSHTDPSYAVRVESGGASLAYTGDSAFCESLVELARGADILLCEASLYGELRGKIPGHMSAGEAGDLAREAGVGALVLTHLPHFGDPRILAAEAKANFGGRVELASKGLRLVSQG